MVDQGKTRSVLGFAPAAPVGCSATSLLTSGFNHDEQHAGRTIILGLSNDEDGTVVAEAQKPDFYGVVQ